MFVLTGRYNNIMKGKAIILLFACKNALLASLSMKIILFSVFARARRAKLQENERKEKRATHSLLFNQWPLHGGVEFVSGLLPIGGGVQFYVRVTLKWKTKQKQ